MSNIQIKHGFTGVVLYEGKSGMSMLETLSKAVEENADLSGAELYGAELSGAELYGAELSGAELYGANLSSANPSSANMSDVNLIDANLIDANLCGADLNDANLCGANLCEKKLVGKHPFFTIGPIGSRSDYVSAYLTDGGVMIRTGCFFDTRDKFELALAVEHGENEHGQEYRAALMLIDKHAELWLPKD